MDAHLILALVALTATCLILWAIAEHRLDQAFAELDEADRVIEALRNERSQ